MTFGLDHLVQEHTFYVNVRALGSPLLIKEHRFALSRCVQASRQGCAQCLLRKDRETQSAVFLNKQKADYGNSSELGE